MRLEDIGPALKRLRSSRGLTQEALAVKFGRQVQTISRLEQPGSDMKVSTLLRLLNALGASLEDLQRALDHPLAVEISEDNERLRTDPPYRELVRNMLTDLGGPNPAPEIAAVLGRIDELDSRVKQLEESRRGVEPIPNGRDNG